MDFALNLLIRRDFMNAGDQSYVMPIMPFVKLSKTIQKRKPRASMLNSLSACKTTKEKIPRKKHLLFCPYWGDPTAQIDVDTFNLTLFLGRTSKKTPCISWPTYQTYIPKGDNLAMGAHRIIGSQTNWKSATPKSRHFQYYSMSANIIVLMVSFSYFIFSALFPKWEKWSNLLSLSGRVESALRRLSVNNWQHRVSQTSLARKNDSYLSFQKNHHRRYFAQSVATGKCYNWHNFQ